VYRNGMHGMEINGNRYIIEHNIVWENGIGLSGTSGIHIFAKDKQQGTGQFNIIRYNTISGQKETDGQDGNGIQLDEWCDNNQIYFNVTFANDGAASSCSTRPTTWSPTTRCTTTCGTPAISTPTRPIS